MINLVELQVPIYFPACGNCAARKDKLLNILEHLVTSKPELVAKVDKIEVSTSCMPLPELKGSDVTYSLTLYRSALAASTQQGEIKALQIKELKKQTSTKKARIACPGLANAENQV